MHCFHISLPVLTCAAIRGAWADWVRNIPASGPDAAAPTVEGAAAAAVLGKDGETSGGGAGVDGDTGEDSGLTYPQPRASSEVMVLVQVCPTGHDAAAVRGKGSHSSTFQLNLSFF